MTVPRRRFKACHHDHVHDLIIVRFVMTIDDHGATTGGQGDEVFVFYKQTSAVRNMDDKWAKRLGVQQVLDFLSFHLFSSNLSQDPSLKNQNLMRESSILFGQRLALGFGSKWKHEQTDQKNCAHRDAGITHRLLLVRENGLSQIPQQSRSQSRHEPA